MLAQAEAAGLTPTGEADRYTLVRRVHLDLLGLPPTLAEAEAFVHDTAPDAYEQMVDRALADPAYGERWARVWLDLARYADSKGYGSDPLRTIWRYRDWVIEAFNRNLPYDQFTIEQLAADLQGDRSPEQMLATAFHRNTMANDEGGTDDEEFRVAAVKDRIETTMQVWMGLTFGCAKCHSHKFDPITQREYYQAYAIFDQTEDADRNDEEPTLRTPTRLETQQLAQYGARTKALKRQLREPPDNLQADVAAWESEVRRQQDQWLALVPREVTSTAGATFEVAPDGSVTVGGASAKSDTYELAADVDVQTITGPAPGSPWARQSAARRTRARGGRQVRDQRDHDHARAGCCRSRFWDGSCASSCPARRRSSRWPKSRCSKARTTLRPKERHRSRARCSTPRPIWPSTARRAANSTNTP